MRFVKIMLGWIYEKSTNFNLSDDELIYKYLPASALVCCLKPISEKKN